MGTIEHSWCPRCGVLDGPLSDGNCDVCFNDDGAIEAVEYLVLAADYRGAVQRVEMVEALVREMLSDEPVRRRWGNRALALIDHPWGQCAAPPRFQHEGEPDV